jgi:polyphenol oxidase
MITHPFQVFEPYRDQLDIKLYTKADQPIDNQDLVSLNQVHGHTTIIARSPSYREKEADGVLTDQPDLTLTIRVADCQAFVIYAPQQHVIGLLHAGWKGLVSGIIPSFFETMQREWQVDSSMVLIGAAPSLCTNCAEFTDPLKELVGIDPQFFHGRHADLRAIADNQLVRCGVKQEHIERMPDCTKCHPDRYWTYRGGDREAVLNGRTNVLVVDLISSLVSSGA